LILNRVTLALWLVAILSNLTAVQRIVYVWQHRASASDVGG
jgi:hypothetical protein